MNGIQRLLISTNFSLWDQIALSLFYESDSFLIFSTILLTAYQILSDDQIWSADFQQILSVHTAQTKSSEFNRLDLLELIGQSNEEQIAAIPLDNIVW